MKVDLKKLEEIISKLPNPETYENYEYHALILEPDSIYAYSGKIPTSGIAKELVFKRCFIRGQYLWYLEY